MATEKHEIEIWFCRYSRVTYVEFVFKVGTNYCLCFKRNGKVDQEATKDYRGDWKSKAHLSTTGYHKIGSKEDKKDKKFWEYDRKNSKYLKRGREIAHNNLFMRNSKNNEKNKT